IVIAIIGPYFTPYAPQTTDVVNKLAPPSSDHWFGTDHHGRDIFSRIIHGMSLTLYVGFASVILGATVGVVLGIISGYYGGRIEDRKSTRLNSSHVSISYAVFCLKKKNKKG